MTTATRSKMSGLFFVLGEDGRTPVEVDGYFDMWARSMSPLPKKRVRWTEHDGCFVSTIFWGAVEHGSDKLFETMVFKGDPKKDASFERELAVWRCATWDEAER